MDDYITLDTDDVVVGGYGGQMVYLEVDLLERALTYRATLRADGRRKSCATFISTSNLPR